MSELIIERAEDGGYIFKKGNRRLDSRVLDCPRARKIKEHALIAAELVGVISWLNKIIPLHEQFVARSEGGMSPDSENIAEDIRAYFIAAVVTYQKYFTKCHGVSITPLNPEKIYNKEQLEMHGRVEELRNKLLAHVDHSDLLSHELHAISDPKGVYTPSILPTFFRTNHFVEDALDDFVQLATFLMNYQNQQFIKAGQALMDKEFGGK